MHACVHPYITQQLLSICLTLVPAGRRSEASTTPSSCKSSGERAPGLRGERPNYRPQAEKASWLTLGLRRIRHESQHQKKPGSAGPAACRNITAQQREPPRAVASHQVPRFSGFHSSAFGKGLRQPLVNAVTSHSFIKE